MRLKMLSNQLRNVGSCVNNHSLVLQLISGLPEAWRSDAILIRQSNPLLAFYQAHSMLTLEEVGMAKMTSTSSYSAMHTTQLWPSEDTSQRGNCARSCGNQGRGGGRGDRHGPHLGAHNDPPPWFSPPWQQQQYSTWKPWGWTPPSWTMPPCPYPTSQRASPTDPPKQSRILGQRPQTYATTTSSQTPTDIETGMHTMSLHTTENQWPISRKS